MMSRKTFWRIVWWYTVFCFWAKPPLYAQTIPADFHGWFLQHVAGKPFGQQTLLDLAPLLPCVGSQITPPNAVGERTKIWDPTTQRWTRVGFGEGYWVWTAQSDGLPPMIEPCQPNPGTPAPTPGTPPAVDLGPLHQEVNTMHALMVQMLNRNEDLSKAERDALAALSAQLKQHDDEPGFWKKVITSPIGVAVLTFLSTALTTWQVTK